MRRLTVWSFLLALAAACGGCPDADPGTQSGDILVIGPSGGEFRHESGIILDLPSGAVDREQEITIVRDDAVPEVSGRQRAGPGFRVAPSTLSFKKAVKVSVPFDLTLIPQGAATDQFDVRRSTEDAGAAPHVIALPGSKADPLRHLVSGETERLGHFWASSPDESALAQLTVTPEDVVANVGDSVSLQATVTDPVEGVLSGVAVTWSVAPRRVASISGHGRLELLAPGTATVTATALGLTKTVKVRVPGNAVGPSTFDFENPFPTGNTLRAGTLLPTGALFAGGNATVLHLDGASNWTRLFSAPATTLRGVAGPAADNLVAAGVSANRGVLVEVSASHPAPVARQFDEVEPTAIWYDGTHGMAVGLGNDVLVRRNGSWQTDDSPSFETLLDVEGDGAGNFVTVGNRGSVYRYDAASSAWTSLYDNQLPFQLVGAALADAAGNEVWAVGSDKGLWHFQGPSVGWISVALPSSPPLDALTAVGIVDGKVLVGARAARTGWVLLRDPSLLEDSSSGMNGSPLVMNGWLAQPLRRFQIPRAIFGVQTAGGTGYVTGDVGSIWHYAAGGFTERSGGEYGDVADVHALSGTEAFAAMNVCADDPCTSQTGRVLSRAPDGSWSPLGGSPQPFTGRVLAVAARSATDVYAGTDSGLWSYNGAAWSPVTVAGASEKAIHDLQLCGGDLWAVGEEGTVYRGANGGAVTLEPALGFNDLYAIHCPSPGVIWVAGDHVLYENRMTRATFGINASPWRAVWSPGFEEAFTFGDASYGLYWNNRALVPVEKPGGLVADVLTGAWGSSIDNLFVVGFTVTPSVFGYAVRHDGVNWTLFDAGFEQPATALHGTGATELFIGTRGGGILRAKP